MSGRTVAYGVAGMAGAAAVGWGAAAAWRALLAGAQVPGRTVEVGEDLDLLFDTLDALHHLGDADDGSPSPDAVYAFSVRWGTMIAGRLVRLAHHSDDGRLNPAEQDRYRQLQTAMREALPLIDRLGLVRPAVVMGPTTSAGTRHPRTDEP